MIWSEMQHMAQYEYDFVISYASEDEEYASCLRSALKPARVFYAPDYQSELWGNNLYESLSQIYSEKGRFCIIIISKYYIKKNWTRLEWQSAQSRALKQIDTAYVLPIRIDDAELPGLPDTVLYLDAKKLGIKEIAQIALKKLYALESGGRGPLKWSKYQTTRLFDNRLSQCLGDTYGLKTVLDPIDIEDILTTLLQPPLLFPTTINPPDSYAVPFWMLRGQSTMAIESFRVLRPNLYLMNYMEFRVSRLDIYRTGPESFDSFVNVTCASVGPFVSASARKEPTFITEPSFLESITAYYVPEINGYISRNDYYSSADSVEYKNAELRVRVVRPFNFSIAPQESKLNSRAEEMWNKLYDCLLSSELSIGEFVEIVSKTHPSMCMCVIDDAANNV